MHQGGGLQGDRIAAAVDAHLDGVFCVIPGFHILSWCGICDKQVEFQAPAVKDVSLQRVPCPPSSANSSARTFPCYFRILRHSSAAKCGNNTEKSELCSLCRSLSYDRRATRLDSSQRRQTRHPPLTRSP